MERPGTGDPLTTGAGWQGASGWLVRKVLSDPGAVAEAQRLIRDGSGLDRYLRARRLIEDGAGHDAVDFRWSARALRAGGYEMEACLLESLTVTENWLHAAAVRWENRYAGREAPGATSARQQLRLGLVSPVGAPHRGIDGSMYQEGRYNGRSAAPRPRAAHDLAGYPYFGLSCTPPPGNGIACGARVRQHSLKHDQAARSALATHFRRHWRVSAYRPV